VWAADTRSSTRRDLIIKERIVRAAYQFFPKHWEGVPEEARALVKVRTAPAPSRTRRRKLNSAPHARTHPRSRGHGPRASAALCVGGIACVLSLITRSSVPLTQISVPLTQLSVPLTQFIGTLYNVRAITIAVCKTDRQRLTRIEIGPVAFVLAASAYSFVRCSGGTLFDLLQKYARK
jgi:hypothetical protein